MQELAQALQSAGSFILAAGVMVIIGVLFSAALASRRRKQQFGSEESLMPMNIGSINDAVIAATVGGRVMYANEVARRWFNLADSEPDLWFLSQRVKPSAAFLELFASEGQAQFTVVGRSITATSHRVAVGDSSQFVVVMREEVPLPTLDKEERGSPRALQTLGEVTRTINASLELDATLKATIEGTFRLINFDAAQICLWDAEAECLVPTMRSGPVAYVGATNNADQIYPPDLGFPGWIARRRQPLHIQDVGSFTDIVPHVRPVDPPVRSYIGVPLTVRNRFIGTFEVMSAIPSTFDRDDLAILSLVSEQAAVAIENARQYSQQAQRVEELSGLQGIAQAISSLQEPYQLFSQLTKRIAELMRVEMAGVLLYDRDEEKLVAQRPMYGVLDNLTSRYAIPLERGSQARNLWDDVQFWFSNDVENDKLVDALGLEELAEMTGVHATVMAAMTLGDERIGVIQVSNKTDGSPFSMEDIRLLQIYADQAAIVVASVRLYSEEQSRVAELQGLQQIVQAMGAVSNPDELYAQLTKRIAELMNVDICGFLIHDNETERLIARPPFHGMKDELVNQLNIPTGKRGLARDVWREAELFASNEAGSDKAIDSLGIREVVKSAGIKTVLLAPLGAGGRRYGLLQVSNKTNGTDFDDGDKRLVSIFAGQAAALIENARLYQDTDATSRRRAAELRSVSRISHELNATLELERILEVISVEALRAEGAKWANLIMLDWNEEKTEIRPLMTFGTDLSADGQVLVQACARSGETLTIEDFEKVSHYPSPITGARSALLTPIKFEGSVVGVIGLFGETPRALDESAAEYIQALSSQATIAVTNATRHQEQVERSGLLARRADQLTQLFELGRMFRTDQSVEGNLDSVARAISESVGFDVALISSLDPQARTLHPVAHTGLAASVFKDMTEKSSPWDAVVMFLDEKSMISTSYLIPAEKSGELVKMMGLPERANSRPFGNGHWSAGTLLALPLRSTTGESIGLLLVDEPKDGMVPTRNTVELLEIFGNQASLVLENSRMYQAMEERAEELQSSLSNLSKSYEELDNLSKEMIRKDLELSQANELLKARAQRLLALHRVMESVDSTRGAQAVLMDIASSVVKEMGVEQCVIAIAEEGESQPTVLAAEGRMPRDISFKQVIDGEDPLTISVRENTPVLYALDSVDRRGLKLAKAIGSQALMTLPLKLDGGKMGALLVGSTRRGTSFGDDDRDLFNLLASQIVVEYENARLYQAVQSEAATAASERDRLQQLHVITTALQQATALEDRINVIARGIRSVGWGKVAVTLLDENMDTKTLVTAGYEANEETLLRKRLLPGDVWRRRFDDPSFSSLRVGSSYFLAQDHPWVIQNVEGGEAKPSGTRKLDGMGRSPNWDPKDQLYLPMYAGSQIIGMVNLRDPDTGLRPTEATLRPLELFVQQAASALENTRLYQETLDLQAYNEAVVESIQQGIVVTDETGKIETYNEFLRSGYQWADDIVGKSIADASPAFKQAGIVDDIKTVSETGEPVEKPNLQLTTGGEAQTVNLYVYPRYDEGKAVTGSVVLIEDITTRARLEADIALRGNQLAALADISREISSTLTVAEVVKTTMDQVKAVIEHEKAALWLTSDDGESVHLAGHHHYTAAEAKQADITIAENNLFKDVFDTQQPVLVGDIRADKRFGDTGELAPRTWLGAPLVTAGKVSGILVLERAAAHAYSPADAQVASAFANQVAVALANAQLFEEAKDRAAELDARNQRLALLSRVSSTIGRSLDENGILQTTADELAGALTAPQVGVWRFDQDNKAAHLLLQHPSNSDGSVADLMFEVDTSEVIKLLRESRAPLVIENVKTDERAVSMKKVMAARKTHSLVALPLIVGNAVIGMISVEHTSKGEIFSGEQLELAQTIINQAAVSVQNAQLFQETVARQRDLSILFEAGRIAGASLDLDKIANSASGYFVRALEVDGCAISLYNTAEQALTALINFDRIGGPRELSADDHRLNLDDYPATESAIAERGIVTLSTHNRDLSKAEVAWLKKNNAEGALVVPLVAREETIGLVELWSATDRRFNQRDIRLARALSTSVATAMENARLLDEAQKRLGELATINDLSRALTQTISTEDLFEMLQERVAELFGAKSLTIAQRSAVTGEQVFPLAVRDGLRIHLDPIKGNGNLYSKVMDQNEPLVISRDVKGKLKEFGVSHVENGLQSFMAVPLSSGEKFSGVLAVESYEAEGVFHDADLRVLGPIAAQVAVSLENARLYGELEQRLSETTTLQEVSRVVNSALDLQEIFQRVVNELASAFKYPLIALFAMEGEQLILRAYHGFSEKDVEGVKSFPLDKGIVGRAARTGEVQLVQDTSKDPDYVQGTPWVVNEISVPIVSDQKVLGILDVQSGADNPLDDTDLQLLRTFAGQVATAMANASLYAQMVNLSGELEQRVEERTKELREEKERIDILYKIAVELTASLDLDMVLNRALKMVGDAVGAQNGSLFLIDPQSDRLIFRSALSTTEILPPGGRQIMLSRHEGMAGWVMDRRESIVVDDVQVDPRWSNVPGTETRRSLLGAPLVANEEVLGCIFFASDVEAAFNEGHLLLVEAAANQVATAINNAELYRLIRDQAERLGAMLRSQQTEAAKSQAILESVADGVMVSDQSGEIILFNAAAERILDLRRDEVLGRPASDLTGLYGSGAAKWATMLREWTANPIAYTGDFLSEQIDVGNKVVSVHASPAVHGDEFVGLVSVFRDISKEVAADRIKSEFVATVSHELRTPMTSIKGYADLLLLGAAGEITPEQRRFLEVVKSNADRLSLLVNDLLDISRIEQGGVDLDIRPIDLREILNDVILSLEGRKESESRSLVIQTDLPEELPKIEGDYDRITQVVTNVVLNAYQYTPDDGAVVVSIKSEEKGLTLEVVDTGIGIPDEDQPRVFERFFRGEDPMVMRTAGTGLGLSIVQHLIKMHGGDIGFVSKQGKGTTFSVYFPFKAARP